ncbi:MAG TPA: alpha/beta hydrolase [Steroidobacteraceae bacterium]|jgi:acetyl esterase/lipase|nr:alpha/beta hydrolase [Steroidobacteraceae bacterium]
MSVLRKAALVASGLAALLVTATAMSQEPPKTPIEAPAEPNAIPLGTGGVEGQTAKETWYKQWGDPFVRNVSRATLTPFLPERSKANGAAVIVAPGGGFRILSMGNEGWEVAQALNKHGVAAFVLKYRLQRTVEDWAEFDKGNPLTAPTPGAPPGPPNFAELMKLPLEDATAAFKMVRARAKEWGIDPNRVGMIGFSAGAGTTMAATLQSTENKPAFIAPIYGSLRAVEVPADAPPMFVALAADDPLFGKSDFGLISAWQKAGRPVEFHLYQNGGHGFGLGNPNRTSTGWFPQFMLWLEVNGMLKGE